MTRTERQAHGFIFQNWVLRKFLDLAYSGEWDIPAKINHLTHKPVSIKTAKWKCGVCLGDATIQFNINQDFEMLLAFYENSGSRKRVVNLKLISLTKEKWRELWGNMAREDLEKFNNFVRNKSCRNLSGDELTKFRQDVQKIKKELFVNYDGKITINPKIDSKGQRRVQCTLPFEVLINELGLKEREENSCELWGETIKLGEIKLD